jgi:hypothetical protein
VVCPVLAPSPLPGGSQTAPSQDLAPAGPAYEAVVLASFGNVAAGPNWAPKLFREPSIVVRWSLSGVSTTRAHCSTFLYQPFWRLACSVAGKRYVDTLHGHGHPPRRRALVDVLMS